MYENQGAMIEMPQINKSNDFLELAKLNSSLVGKRIRLHGLIFSQFQQILTHLRLNLCSANTPSGLRAFSPGSAL